MSEAGQVGLGVCLSLFLLVALALGLWFYKLYREKENYRIFQVRIISVWDAQSLLHQFQIDTPSILFAESVGPTVLSVWLEWKSVRHGSLCQSCVRSREGRWGGQPASNQSCRPGWSGVAASPWSRNQPQRIRKHGITFMLYSRYMPQYAIKRQLKKTFMKKIQSILTVVWPKGI